MKEIKEKGRRNKKRKRNCRSWKHSKSPTRDQREAEKCTWKIQCNEEDENHPEGWRDLPRVWRDLPEGEKGQSRSTESKDA